MYSRGCVLLLLLKCHAHQFRNQQKLPNCVASSNQNIPPSVLKDISSVVGVKIIDVPRGGTAYSVFFSSYGSQKALGMIAYDGLGNTFNLAVKFSNSKWKLSSFNACNQRN